MDDDKKVCAINSCYVIHRDEQYMHRSTGQRLIIMEADRDGDVQYITLDGVIVNVLYSSFKESIINGDTIRIDI